MRWDRVRSAVLTALSAFRRLGTARHGRLGPALNIAPRSAPGGSSGAPKTAIDLRARAERRCNRSQKLVALYLERHRVLMTGKDR
jgi:hypothetical protein